MTYADWAYYKTDYLGEAIGEAAFPRLALRASERIDALTEGRAAAYYENVATEPLQKAACAVAEMLHQLEGENALVGGNSSRNNAVLTEITGKYHVQYAAPINTANAEGKRLLDAMLMEAASAYLLPTGLMYRGW